MGGKWLHPHLHICVTSAPVHQRILEGHPTPRLAFADVATCSLGQGLGIGVGMALAARMDKLDYNDYNVLMGDERSTAEERRLGSRLARGCQQG